MKALCVLLCIISTVHVAAFEKEKKGTIAPRAPANTPSGSLTIPRTSERASFDSLFEPKQNTSSCADHCICVRCLERSCCELDKIQSKLTFLGLMLKNAKNSKDGKSAAEEVTAARMMAKIIALRNESKKLKLIPKKVKNSPKAEKKATKGPKLEGHKGNFKQTSSVHGSRLTTSGDDSEDEAYQQLTNSSRDSFLWRLRQAGADLV